MVPAQNMKVANAVDPDVIKDNAAFTASEIDTKGFDYAQIIVYLGDTDIAMAALKVTECDTTGGSFTDVTGLIFGTSTNTAGDTSALPTALEDNSFFVFDIDLAGRKRFLKLAATAGDGATGTYLTAIAILSRPGILPTTAAARGALQILRV